MMTFEAGLDFALKCDGEDTLQGYRDRFFVPQHNGEDAVYLCGNSLGLQPKKASEFINGDLESWSKYGVEGHFEGVRPWLYYHHNFKEYLARLVGAKAHEVVAMNTLTVNLHLMMVSFYRPDSDRFKIICEKDAFPSDMYALETQAKFHGLDPDEAIVEVAPREGEHTLRQEDILEAINTHGSQLALTMFSGVQYYTGQLFDLEAITWATHEAGALAGFDLAHAAGNVPLQLHDWNIDFGVWCSYKYLNSGPGGVAGAYVHEKHHRSDLPQFAGWWGHNEEERFLMEKGFQPMESVDRWQLSNAPVFNMAAHLASLELFEEVGMDQLREKSLKMTAYMEFLLRGQVSDKVEIITPTDPNKRGCQLSLFVDGGGKSTFERISRRGVIADWREPNVIRVAPVPLYNSYQDVYKFVNILKEEVEK